MLKPRPTNSWNELDNVDQTSHVCYSVHVRICGARNFNHFLDSFEVLSHGYDEHFNSHALQPVGIELDKILLYIRLTVGDHENVP